MVEPINITNLCNITVEKIKELYRHKENSDQAGDATWILTSAFIIFTMQSGFGLLEAGSVSSKNESNIMIKNAVDVIFGGLGYWACGFAFSFGDDPVYSNGFSGFGHFFVDTDTNNSGALFAKYFFQLSFATTATTIVSGAMAERTNLKAYMFFSFVNFLAYVFPAHWIWADNGFLKNLGVVDVAGCGPVHIVGGTSAIVASVILKPRSGVFDGDKRSMASPTNVVLGTFMLWWGWLGFNCGSTFGVSGGKWKLASRAAVTTVNSSVGGGMWSIFYCYFISKQYKGKLDIGIFTSCILGGLVSITAICAICKPWEALLIGMTGGFIVTSGMFLMHRIKVDDPVTCIPVHCFCGIWGLLCVGLFGDVDNLEGISHVHGIAKGGPISFFGYQCLAALTIVVWAGTVSAIQLLIADCLFGLRVSELDELIGADAAEHGIDIQHFHFHKRGSAFGQRTSTKRRSLKKYQKKLQSVTNSKINIGYLFESSNGVDNFGFSFGNSDAGNPSWSNQSETIATSSFPSVMLSSSSPITSSRIDVISSTSNISALSPTKTMRRPLSNAFKLSSNNYHNNRSDTFNKMSRSSFSLTDITEKKLIQARLYKTSLASRSPVVGRSNKNRNKFWSKRQNSI